jgi:DNA topoisomerase-2
MVNAADNFYNDRSMNAIKVNISQEKNEIKVWNNGKGVPIEMHKTYDMMVPELIFGNLMTSSNYDDKEEKVTGGRNGFGAKLTNIFSTRFIVRTGDSKRGLVYEIEFYDNLKHKKEHKITKKPTADFTEIIFYPDLEKFGMNELEDDIVSLMTKRVYDMAGVTDRKVKTFFNGE